MKLAFPASAAYDDGMTRDDERMTNGRTATQNSPRTGRLLSPSLSGSV